MPHTSPATQRRAPLLATLAPALLLAAPAHGQCEPQWLSGQSQAILSGPVHTLTHWDPDGPGPLEPRLVIGGDFFVAGGTTLNRVAIWNGAAWAPLDGGVTNVPPVPSPTVSALAALPDGGLIVAGRFNRAGAVLANSIARWDGEAWHPLGSGLTGGTDPMINGVRALLVLPGGDVIAGGDFTLAGGVPASRIARWSAATGTWSPLGSGIAAGAGPQPTVFALALLPSGDIVAAGRFQAAGGVAAANIARWDGTAWSPLGSGTTDVVNTLQVLPSGELAAGGSFLLAGGVWVNRVAKWDGAAWSPCGSGLNEAVRDLALDSSGALVAGGAFIGGTGHRIARWNGSAWATLGLGMDQPVNAIERSPEGDLVAGGHFAFAGQRVSWYVARWVETPRPRFGVHPAPVSAAAGDPATLSAMSLTGIAEVQGGLSFQWRRNGVPIADGPGGASAGGGGGGVVVGASGMRFSTSPITLTISGVHPSDAGLFTLELTNACGEAVSLPAQLTVTPAPCPADWDASGIVNSGDISAFLTSWLASIAAPDLVADVNGDGTTNSGDISYFLTAWLAAVGGGC